MNTDELLMLVFSKKWDITDLPNLVLENKEQMSLGTNEPERSEWISCYGQV